MRLSLVVASIKPIPAVQLPGQLHLRNVLLTPKKKYIQICLSNKNESKKVSSQ